MTTLAEFLDGQLLTWEYGNETIQARYEAEVGISLLNGKKKSLAEVKDKLGASRFYYNVTRRRDYDERPSNHTKIPEAIHDTGGKGQDGPAGGSTKKSRAQARRQQRRNRS